jgi:hypothetical protein
MKMVGEALRRQRTQKQFINVRFLIVIVQFKASIATNVQGLTYFVNVSYVEGHKRESNLSFSLDHLYSVTVHNILMWICDAYYNIVSRDGVTIDGVWIGNCIY